ncbi:MAG: phytanoyl-CoA hydroxylase [Abditibacteriota bacterium]|nr:phytanoyl-CoA hydroxylase [Abditibacteriota bacterium]
MAYATKRILKDEQVEQFERDGFLVVRGLLSPQETTAFRERFMTIQQDALDPQSTLRAYYAPKTLDEADGDVLKHFPRIMHPHRFDATSFDYMLDARFESVLCDLFGEEALAAQSMLYFKPPGARGQALHQDNFYLKVSPGNCLAAWVALDAADDQNGTLFVVPGSHKLDVLCPHAADLSKSFTTEEVDVPAGMEAVKVDLAAGDVLFFAGTLIHGSYPNVTRHRFRRAFICHYVPQSTLEMSSGYYPLHTFGGEKIERGHAQGGGPCGSEEWAAFQAGIEAQIQKNPGDAGAKASLEWLKKTAVA